MIQTSLPTEYKGIQVKPLDSWFVKIFPKLKYPRGEYNPVLNVIYCNSYLSEDEVIKTLEHEYRHYLQFTRHTLLKKFWIYYFNPALTRRTILTSIGIVFLLPDNKILNLFGAIIVFFAYSLIGYLEYDADNYSGDKFKGISYCLLWIFLALLIIIGRWSNNFLLWFSMALAMTIFGIVNPLAVLLLVFFLISIFKG